MAGAEVKIRVADSEDKEKILELLSEIFPESAEFYNEDTYFLAERGKEAVGFGHLKEKKERAYLQGIGVKEDERGRGTGTKLIEYMLDYCDRKGFQKITLKVKAENPAVGLYLKKGFLVKKMGKSHVMVRKQPN